MNDKFPTQEVSSPQLPEWLLELPQSEQIAYQRLFSIMLELPEKPDR